MGLLKMTQKRGEMGHKKEMPHRVGHDNVIARVREERERNARCYLAAVKRPLRGICTFHVSHLSCLSEVIA